MDIPEEQFDFPITWNRQGNLMSLREYSFSSCKIIKTILYIKYEKIKARQDFECQITRSNFKSI